MPASQSPAVFLHQVERQYRQGDVTLEILKGAELAVWSGQMVALIAPVPCADSVDAPVPESVMVAARAAVP